MVDLVVDVQESGQSDKQLMATAAYASSDVSPYTSFLFYYGRNTQSSGNSNAGNKFEVNTLKLNELKLVNTFE